jgi:hypothetical protein
MVLIPNPAQAQSCDRVQTIEAVSDTGDAPMGAICRTYKGQSGTQGASCHWPFEYRDPSAQTIGRELWQEVQHCREGAQLTENNEVNHPDSYDLLVWETKNGIYHISVKDKGALQQTLLFFRFERF